MDIEAIFKKRCEVIRMKSYEDMESLLRMYLRKYFSTTAEGWEQRADVLRYVMEIPQNEFEKIWMEEYEEVESYNRMVESMQGRERKQ